MVTRAAVRPLITRPTVSVVVPCYNYGHFLPECVHSVLAQEGVDVDVLIVDDASPDGSVRVARELAATDPRVHVIEQSVNLGHIATYNNGLSKASGEHVVLLSADDLLAPGSLARSAALLEAHPEVGFVYGFSAGFTDQVPKHRSRASSWSIWSGSDWLYENLSRATNPVATPEVVMRASTVRDLKGYDPRVPHGADYLLWLRAATRGSVGRINGADQAFYRVHGANMHVQQFGGMYRDIIERNLVLEILFADEGNRLAALPGLHDSAKMALAREALYIACRAYKLNHTDIEPPERMAKLASTIAPELRDSRLWRRYERHTERHRSNLLLLKSRMLADRFSRRMRWGRWRRSGLRV